MSQDKSEIIRAKHFACLSLLLGLILASGLPAWAQRPLANPQDMLIDPEGFVVAGDVPRVGPPSLAHIQAPILFPDPDLLMQRKQELGSLRTQPTPTSSVQAQISPTGVSAPTGFSGLQFSESGGYIPPDTQVAAGPNYIFEAVNLEGRIWTKDGALVTTFDLASFFGLSSSVPLSDPKIRFDPLSNRWFVLVISFNSSFTSGAWRLAVSTNQDPFSFVRYSITTSKSAPDFPALGINDDKVVLTANAFRGNSFVGTEFMVLNKANLLNGTSAAATYFAPPQGLFTIQPAHSLSTTCSAPNTSPCTLYMAAVAFNSATSVRIWSIKGVPGVGAGVTSTTKDLPIAALSSPPDAKQLGSSVLIQTNDNRLLDASFRNGVLWVSANSACVPAQDTAGRACLRFMEFSTTAGIAKSQEFDFGMSGRYYYYPAIQIDGGGNLIAVFSGSSASDYASVYASGQRITDPLNSLQAPVVIKQGENAYTPFANRWGDYSGAGIDPSNQSVVWLAGEYAAAAGGSAWGTWIVPVQMSP